MTWTRRHQYAVDLRAVTDAGQRRVLQSALNAVEFPLSRVRRRTGRRIPVAVTDTTAASRAILGEQTETLTDAQVHEQAGRQGVIPLLDAANRRVTLGLFWLPTAQFPAGRIEVGLEAVADPALAGEVLVAELAHAVDYGLPLPESVKATISGWLCDRTAPGHGTHGWFAENGSQDYWTWLGETFMPLFVRAFAPALPRPLEARQPWAHPVSDRSAARLRTLLR